MAIAVTVAYWNDIISRINALRADSGPILPPLSTLAYLTPPPAYVIEKGEITRLQAGLKEICPTQPYTNPFDQPPNSTILQLYVDELEAGITNGWCVPRTRETFKVELRWRYKKISAPLDMSIPQADLIESVPDYKIGQGDSNEYIFQRRVYYSRAEAFDFQPSWGYYGDMTVNRVVDGSDSEEHGFEEAIAEIRVYGPDGLGNPTILINAFCAVTAYGWSNPTFNMYPNQFFDPTWTGNINDGAVWYAGKFYWFFLTLDDFRFTAPDCPQWCYWEQPRVDCQYWWVQHPDHKWNPI